MSRSAPARPVGFSALVGMRFCDDHRNGAVGRHEAYGADDNAAMASLMRCSATGN
jgi:hypothetical protein